MQDLNENVAISEEFPNNASGTVKSGGLMFDRKVTRTITPGTLIDESFMNPYENNFLLAIYSDTGSTPVAERSDRISSVPTELKEAGQTPSMNAKKVGLAWLDLSTGDFFTQMTNVGPLLSAVARIGAREIVLLDKKEENASDGVQNMLEQQRQIVAHHPADLQSASIQSWTSMLESEVPETEQRLFSDEEVKAGSLLLSYLYERLPGSAIKLQPPHRQQDKETMTIDKNSMRALEILGTSKEGLGGGKGSLLHTLKRTVTKSGARLLRAWVAAPSMSLDVINPRLDLVALYLADHAFRRDVVSLLKRSHDSQRLVQKFSMGRGDADDLISLLRTIDATNDIAKLIRQQLSSKDSDVSFSQQNSLQRLYGRLSTDDPSSLADKIRASIDEEGLQESHMLNDDEGTEITILAQNVLHNEGTADDQVAMSQVIKSKAKQKPPSDVDTEFQAPWILRRSASEQLLTLHLVLDDLQADKFGLTNRLRNVLESQSLTLRWTSGLGYICHVKGNRDVSSSIKKYATSRDVKTTKSTRSFHHPEWSDLGSRIDQARTRIRAEEQRVLQELRGQVVVNLVKLRRNASVLDELDIYCAFASLAEEQGFVRPILNNGLDHKIIGGRHPTVKLGLEEQGRAFVSNDCSIGEKERIWLITGPNMAGKSTFLRQNALISVIAQIGSFVPAEYAEIGLVDQIFTRVGSADNLFRDQSTFMVEMMETAAILNQATPQSFVIMDEIGRGTTPEDGIAVGFACLHHLYHKNKCRTLFATHFHSLADMTKAWENLGCYCTDVAEGSGGSFSFVHRLRPGVNRSSHALKVAALAGVPKVAIETARTVLEGFEKQSTQQDRVH